MLEAAAAAESTDVFLPPSHLAQRRSHLGCAILIPSSRRLIPVGVQMFIKHVPVV
jgi:hypothetical protein